MRRSKKIKIIVICIMLIIAFMLPIELLPYGVHHSVIFTSGDQTEIKLCVLANTFFIVDEEDLAEKVVQSHVSINGTRPNTTYELEIYRTNIHYKQNWKYDTIFCDENGNIL